MRVKDICSRTIYNYCVGQSLEQASSCAACQEISHSVQYEVSCRIHNSLPSVRIPSRMNQVRVHPSVRRSCARDAFPSFFPVETLLGHACYMPRSLYRAVISFGKQDKSWNIRKWILSSLLLLLTFQDVYLTEHNLLVNSSCLLCIDRVYYSFWTLTVTN